MLLYHATKQGNASSILSKGLLPNKQGKVYLSPTIPNALASIDGRGWNEVSIVCVDIKKPPRPNKDGAILYLGGISPNYIIAVEPLIEEAKNDQARSRSK